MKRTILAILFSCALAVTTHAEAKTYDFNKSVGVYSSANDAGWDFSDAADQGARLTGRSKALPSAPIYFSVNVQLLCLLTESLRWFYQSKVIIIF